MLLTERAQLALDTLFQKPTKGIPTWIIHIMEHSQIEHLAGVQPGEYKKNPEKVYLACQYNIGVCMIDQYIPENPLSMGKQGYETTERTATTGAKEIVCNSIAINSPEAVVEHLEKFVLPTIQKKITEFNEDKYVNEILKYEADTQKRLGPGIIKFPYSINFPEFRYIMYGYENYFMAYALYPEVIEKDFSMQADLGLLENSAIAKAHAEGKLLPYHRLDHDMADSKGTLVDIRLLDKIWFPHFARCIEPLVKSNIHLLWHCDGNLMEMIPRLLEVGITGFQGFQYEANMDYEKICKLKTKNNNELIIIGGVSVTRTLPKGTPDDVKNEIDWLVEKGPKTGLFLGCSSSVTPGVPWENIYTLVEGLKYYREHERS